MHTSNPCINLLVRQVLVPSFYVHVYGVVSRSFGPSIDGRNTYGICQLSIQGEEKILTFHGAILECH